MKTRFPGMNPFLEGQEWEDFHTRFNTAITEALSPKLHPRYAVRVERRVYVETVSDESDDRHFRADAAIVSADREGGAVVEQATIVAPVEGWIEMEEERRETYLVIRDVESHKVITVLETLSPANKRSGGDGRREYLRKRREILNSPSHLVEIDLLRSGTRMPVSPAPAGDYHVIVSRDWSRPKVEIFAWNWRSPLPEVPVPLRRSDGDVALDLQAVVTAVCDRADYDLTLNYESPLKPPLAAADADWLRQFLVNRTTITPN